MQIIQIGNTKKGKFPVFLVFFMPATSDFDVMSFSLVECK